ncbi:hypothetical protein EK21DRAFT_118456 [Setomelanomma holmii]|uniref:DUF7924 domain-containing protein n=1 Tax=Setomelanomma holmii TaxID=210430 RepID=A0A9P4GZ24_9PLEO|nr:hypothetical protein EK21DRAFT_118456 [Setomelanomma holmii]
MENESTGRKMMEGHLLFYGEGHDGGIPGLTLKDQVNLDKDHFTLPPRSTVPELWGTLPRPQADSCIGYVTATMRRHDPPLMKPFSREEDEIAEWYSVVHHSDTHFPILTAQWKAAISGDHQIDARLQAARDGAPLVNYMHRFYLYAYPDRDPSQLETCHVSLTTEMISSYLRLRWREVDSVDDEVYYRMEPIESAHLHKLRDVAATRKVLHNYIDYTIGERLKSIKAALCPFWQNRPARRARRRQSQSSTTASSLNLQFDMPMTPSTSSRGEENASATKRLKRTLNNGM